MKKSDQHRRRNIMAEGISVATAVLLGIIKAIAGSLSGSLSLLASALDSLLDSLVSVVNLYTIRAAAKPPDSEHRFGYGKFEAFAEFLQGILIGFSGLYLAKESFRRFLSPSPLYAESVAMGVMIFSLSTTFFLVIFLRKTAKRTGSIVVKADSEHYFSDILSNIAIIGGLIMIHFTKLYITDAFLSLGIALIILHSSGKLLLESFRILTDHELPQKTRKKIEMILGKAEKPVTGWHLLRTRRSGTQVHIDYHLVFNDSISLHDAHNVSEKIEKKIQAEIPHSVILTHLDPHDDSRANKEMARE